MCNPSVYVFVNLVLKQILTNKREMMQSNWEKREKVNKMKALFVAVLVHVIFLMGIMSFGGSSSSEDGGISNWLKTKFQGDQTESIEPVAKS